ncbi:ATP-dependent DNA ligase [Bradyrhizobium ottawaense]
MNWSDTFRDRYYGPAYVYIAGSAIVDGEVVVPAADGTTDFSVLQNELNSLVLVAFDLLYLNGRDLRKLPLFQRKAELKKIWPEPRVESLWVSRQRRKRWSWRSPCSPPNYLLREHSTLN